MTATKNNVPPSSTLVMTALVPRNIPSSKNCTLRSPVRFQSTKRTLHVLLLPRITLPRTPVHKSSAAVRESAVCDHWRKASSVRGGRSP
jgi:hypothetical protein